MLTDTERERAQPGCTSERSDLLACDGVRGKIEANGKDNGADGSGTKWWEGAAGLHVLKVRFARR